MKQLFYGATVVATLVGCHSVTIAKGEPIPLIAEFRSFDAPASVAAGLKSKGLAFEEADRQTRKGPAGAPAFEKLVWRIARYPHMGHSGELLLQFHNGRLMEVVFYPDEVAPFLERLKATGYVVPSAIPLSPGSPATLRPPTPAGESLEVLAVTDSRGRQYVMWGDRRIRAEYLSWLNAYA